MGAFWAEAPILAPGCGGLPSTSFSEAPSEVVAGAFACFWTGITIGMGITIIDQPGLPSFGFDMLMTCDVQYIWGPNGKSRRDDTPCQGVRVTSCSTVVVFRQLVPSVSNYPCNNLAMACREPDLREN